MRTFRSVVWRLGLVVGLIACGACGTLQPRIKVQLLPAVDRACANWRRIGISSTPTCPALGAGWSVQQLFSAAPKGEYSRGVAQVQGEMARFCLYEWGGPGVPALPPPPNPGLVRLDRDCATLAPSSTNDDIHAMTRAVLEREFRQKVGWVDLLPRPKSFPVRLTFVDTQPTDTGVPSQPGYSTHGFTLTHIARELACSETNGYCAAEIATRLALSIRTFDANSQAKTTVDATNGGVVGTVGELAKAIHDEIDAWSGPAGESRQHLILNLSVGWDGELFGAANAPVRCLPIADYDSPAPGAQPLPDAGLAAVCEALEYAAAKGVLVIAAAGNRRAGNPEATAPLLPARLEGTPTPPMPGVIPGPLVYAVGGLQANDTPLASSRPGGMPPLAAYADHVVVKDRGEQQLPAMTGTSVAAAVVSAAAAVVWQAQPELTPAGVMDIVMRTGSELTDLTADYKYPDGISTPTTVKRLNLCAALNKACGNCLPPSQCSTAATTTFTADLEADLTPFHPKMQRDGLRFKSAKLPSTRCSSSQISFRWWQPAHPCPDQEAVSAASVPWVYPQPQVDPCPTCVLSPGRPPGDIYQKTVDSRNSMTLQVKIRDDWKGSLSSPTLQIKGKSGTTKVDLRYALPTKALGAGDSIELSGIMIDPTTTVTWVSLSFLGNDGLSYISPVLLAPPTPLP